VVVVAVLRVGGVVCGESLGVELDGGLMVIYNWRYIYIGRCGRW